MIPYGRPGAALDISGDPATVRTRLFQFDFFEAAKRHGRRDLLVGTGWAEDGAAASGGWILFLMRLILATHHWLLDCREMAGAALAAER